MRSSLLKMVAALAVSGAAMFAAGPAQASVIAVADPGGTTTEIGSRIRWGNTGFEASIFDPSPSLNQSPTLNPGGTPVWQVGSAYKFEIKFDSSTGLLSLSIDFDRNNSFGASESISRSTFIGTASYLNTAFNYLSISVDQSLNSTANSKVENLFINGALQANLAPGAGASLTQYYRDNSLLPMSLITITGDLTFLTAGTAQESPSWNFRLKNAAPVTEAPEPSTVALIGMALLSMFGFGLMRRRAEA